MEKESGRRGSALTVELWGVVGPTDVQISGFDAMPSEIVLAVLMCLNACDQRRAALVCRRWHSINNDALMWKHRCVQRWFIEEEGDVDSWREYYFTRLHQRRPKLDVTLFAEIRKLLTLNHEASQLLDGFINTFKPDNFYGDEYNKTEDIGFIIDITLNEMQWCYGIDTTHIVQRMVTFHMGSGCSEQELESMTEIIGQEFTAEGSYNPNTQCWMDSSCAIGWLSFHPTTRNVRSLFREATNNHELAAHTLRGTINDFADWMQGNDLDEVYAIGRRCGNEAIEKWTEVRIDLRQHGNSLRQQIDIGIDAFKGLLNVEMSNSVVELVEEICCQLVAASTTGGLNDVDNLRGGLRLRLAIGMKRVLRVGLMLPAPAASDILRACTSFGSSALPPSHIELLRKLEKSMNGGPSFMEIYCASKKEADERAENGWGFFLHYYTGGPEHAVPVTTKLPPSRRVLGTHREGI